MCNQGKAARIRTILLSILVGVFYSTASHAAEPKQNAQPNFAFVLLTKPELPNPSRIVDNYARLDPSGRLVAKTPKYTKKEPILEFNTPGNGTVFVLLLPAPVPKGEAENAVRFSASSFMKDWQLPKHSAHLLVTFSYTSENRVDVLVRFTRLLAAVSDASAAVGIYWGAAGATHDSKFFSEYVREQEPTDWLPLWTGVSIASENSSRASLLSLGMRQLGLPDLLLTAPKLQADDAIATLFDLLSYIASRGKAIPEGDTVGPSATDRWKVRYVASPLNPKERVWRVDMP